MAKLQMPNVAGCLIGFAAAGCGFGSLVGTAVGPLLYTTPPDGQGKMDERMLTVYEGTFLGMKVGAVVGSVAGILYAVLVRRLRLRRTAAVAEDG